MLSIPILHPVAEMVTRLPTIAGNIINDLAPCTPIGLPSNTTCCRFSLTNTPNIFIYNVYI